MWSAMVVADLLYLAYHDEEWGSPRTTSAQFVRDADVGGRAGLSWSWLPMLEQPPFAIPHADLCRPSSPFRWCPRGGLDQTCDAWYGSDSGSARG